MNDNYSTLDLSRPTPFSNLEPFTFGTATNPAGTTLTTNGVCLLENGRPILPVMGEFHYTRYPRAEWRDELLKMRAGGVTIVASYVFWIHHEEVEGQFDWTGDRDLRAFVLLCGEVGLRFVARCGPWAHGEVRNGGLPEWLLEKGVELRTDDPAYLAEVERFYAAIARQLAGTLWKDGGPVIGVQIENEYSGRAEHLLTLRELAIRAGLDVPYYTRTGWPELDGTLAFGKLLPLYGGYAEGFWDREVTTMPGRYWKEFAFKTVRTDTAIASEHFGSREAKDEDGIDRYPYLTCELGAGMMCSYHRRIEAMPMDALSMPIVKLGSGSNLPGYYMYHGGTNPGGIEPNLQEHQATRYTNYNDLPTKNYDFQTALGEFGQIRPQYHLLRPLHLFLADFGPRLATMPTALPDMDLTRDDTHTLRYGVRTDGHSGFVFINNYQRLLPMPAKPNVQFSFKLKDDALTFPSTPVTVAADHTFFWPFNLDLGDGVILTYATAQLVCTLEHGGTRYTVFASTGNATEFAFAGQTVLSGVQGSRKPIATFRTASGREHRILILDESDARQIWKGQFAGEERLVIAPEGVIFDGDSLRLTTTGPADVTVALLPAPPSLLHNGQAIHGCVDGAFTRFSIPQNAQTPVTAIAIPTKPHGPLRNIQIGVANVAMSPTTADFEQAGEWRITLPPDIDASRQLLLRIRYEGDVARAYVGDQLLTDNFYNGTPFDIGLNRFGRDIFRNGLTLKILPLQKDAPIYMLDRARPDFAGQASVARVLSVEVIETHETTLSTI